MSFFFMEFDDVLERGPAVGQPLAKRAKLGASLGLTVECCSHGSGAFDAPATPPLTPEETPECAPRRSRSVPFLLPSLIVEVPACPPPGGRLGVARSSSSKSFFDLDASFYAHMADDDVAAAAQAPPAEAW